MTRCPGIDLVDHLLNAIYVSEHVVLDPGSLIVRSTSHVAIDALGLLALGGIQAITVVQPSSFVSGWT